MEKLTGLIEFIYVVDQGGFNAAATALDRSASFVSRRVSALEDRLGTRLLHRTTRRVQLTDVGAQYYESAVALLNSLNNVETEITDNQKLAAGVIKITAGGKFGEDHLAAVLADFAKLYPKVNIRLDITSLRTDIIAEGFDLAVRHATPGDADLIARKLTSRRVMVCGSPDYFAEHGYPETPADLKEHNCLVSWQIPWVFQLDGEETTMKVSGKWTSNSGDALAQATIRGLGIARLAGVYIEQAVQEGKLEVILTDFEVPPSTTYLVYPDREFLPHRVRLLIDFLADRFR